MLLVQRDEPTGFEALSARNRTLVVRYLSRMVRNRAVAEELAQDVFLRVYRSRHSYEPSARFSTWLYRIATNVALNHFRDDRRRMHNVSLDWQDAERARREAPDGRPLIEDALAREATAREIRHAVLSLPPKQRAAVIMHKYEELEYAEIAAVLGCTPSAVKALMFRAYEILRGRLRHLTDGR